MTDNDNGTSRPLDLNDGSDFELFSAMDGVAHHLTGNTWHVADGFFKFEIDTDVYLGLWGKVVSAGAYQVEVGVGINADEGMESVAWLSDGSDSHDREAPTVIFDVSSDVYDADRHRIDLAEGRPLAYSDLLLWLAIQDADAAGDTARADSYFRTAYGLERSEVCCIGDNPTPLAAPVPADKAPKMEQIKPYRHYTPNARTTEALTTPAFFNGTAAINVGKRKGQLTIDFDLSWSDGEAPASIDLSQPIDKEDVRVIASVVTLKKAGNVTVSPFQIAETMGYGMPTAELQAEIHDRVMKLRNIDGHIDWTAQARYYHINNPETGKPWERAEITGHLIDCTVFDGTDTDGNRHIRYQLLSDPITYQHAHQLGQVVDYPQRLLGLKPVNESGKRRGRVTREQTQIADSVLWYVYSVLNPKNSLSESIRYDTLFERAGVDVSHYKKRQRAVVFVNDYLRALQQEGIIGGFSVYAPGTSHKPVSVRIVTPKRGNVTKRRRR